MVSCSLFNCGISWWVITCTYLGQVGMLKYEATMLESDPQCSGRRLLEGILHLYQAIVTLCMAAALSIARIVMYRVNTTIHSIVLIVQWMVWLMKVNTWHDESHITYVIVKPVSLCMWSYKADDEKAVNCFREDSNPQPLGFLVSGVPTELPGQSSWLGYKS